jgi:hypothetical protein
MESGPKEAQTGVGIDSVTVTLSLNPQASKLSPQAYEAPVTFVNGWPFCAPSSADNPDDPLIVCHASAQERTRFKWTRAEIPVKYLAEHVPRLLYSQTRYRAPIPSFSAVSGPCFPSYT